MSRALCFCLVAPLVFLGTAWGRQSKADKLGSYGKVTLDMFVMSRCPDALHCEDILDQVLEEVKSIAEVRPNYIADTHEPLVTCKHGGLECAGNKQQLCFFKLAPDFWWEFLMCQDKSSAQIGSLALAERCLAASGADEDTREDIRLCFNGSDGEAALRKSAEQTASKGVTKSCTIFVDGVKRCIFDGGISYDCDGGSEVIDFVRSICEAYWSKTGTWPNICGRQPALGTSMVEA